VSEGSQVFWEVTRGKLKFLGKVGQKAKRSSIIPKKKEEQENYFGITGGNRKAFLQAHTNRLRLIDEEKENRGKNRSSIPIRGRRKGMGGEEPAGPVSGGGRKGRERRFREGRNKSLGTQQSPEMRRTASRRGTFVQNIALRRSRLRRPYRSHQKMKTGSGKGGKNENQGPSFRRELGREKT